MKTHQHDFLGKNTKQYRVFLLIAMIFGLSLPNTFSISAQNGNDVIEIEFPQPGKKKLADGTWICEVKFFAAPDHSFADAEHLAQLKGWQIATSEEILAAMEHLDFQPNKVAWVAEGSLAAPSPKAAGKLKKGVNPHATEWRMPEFDPYHKAEAQYPLAGINEGFFYTECHPKTEVNKQSGFKKAGSLIFSPQTWKEHDRYSNMVGVKSHLYGRGYEKCFDYDRFNVMIDGWVHDEKPLLEAAARKLLQAEGKPNAAVDIGVLSLELKIDAVRRWEFIPYMIAELYEALETTSPNAAQAAYQARFNKCTTCKGWLYSMKVWEEWKTHTNHPGAITGQGGVGKPTSYPYPTLSVWKDIMRDRATTKGFSAPEEMARQFAANEKGSKTTAMIYAPLYATMLPDFEDKANLKAIAEPHKSILQQAVGATTILGGSMATGQFVKHEALKIAIFNAKTKEALKADDISELRRQMGVQEKAQDAIEESSEKVAKKIGKEATEELSEEVVEKASKEGAKKLSKKIQSKITKKFAQSLTKQLSKKVGKKIATQAGTEVAKHLFVNIGPKIGTALAVVGVVATAGQILGEELADIIGTEIYHNQVRDAIEWRPDNVSAFLNAGSSEDDTNGRKIVAFNQLIYYAVTVPAARGVLTLEYPEIPTLLGKKKDAYGIQHTDVKFFKAPLQTLEHAQKMAASRNMRLATAEELAEAWFHLLLEGEAGMIADGSVAWPRHNIKETPVNFDLTTIPVGLNFDMEDSSQGFYYVDIEPVPGQTLTPVEPIDNTPVVEEEIKQIKNVWLKSFVQVNAENEVLLNAPVHGLGDDWKIVKHEDNSSVQKGYVRLYNKKARKYLMYDANSPNNLKIGVPVNDPFFLMLGNYGFWELVKYNTEDPESNTYYIKANKYYLHTEGGQLQAGEIQAGWQSPLWELLAPVEIAAPEPPEPPKPEEPAGPFIIHGETIDPYAGNTPPPPPPAEPKKKPKVEINTIKTLSDGQPVQEALLETAFKRENATNAYHSGGFTELENGNLQWKNDAGIAWELESDYENELLKIVSENNAYANTKNGTFFKLLLEEGQLKGFQFMNDVFLRQ